MCVEGKFVSLDECVPFFYDVESCALGFSSRFRFREVGILTVGSLESWGLQVCVYFLLTTFQNFIQVQIIF